MELRLEPIGTVRNGLDRRPTDGWRDKESVIELRPEFEGGLRGIAEYSHVVVLFWLDRMDPEARRTLVVHPRGDESAPLTGVFATRSQRRPNPIGITRVELCEVDGPSLRVRGLDALDGTPVLDIKGDKPESGGGPARYPQWTGSGR